MASIVNDNSNNNNDVTVPKREVISTEEEEELLLDTFFHYQVPFDNGKRSIPIKNNFTMKDLKDEIGKREGVKHHVDLFSSNHPIRISKTTETMRVLEFFPKNVLLENTYYVNFRNNLTSSTGDVKNATTQISRSVTIITPSGNSINVAVNVGKETVLDLKRKIFDLEKIPLRDQNLLKDMQTLANKTLLSDDLISRNGIQFHILIKKNTSNTSLAIKVKTLTGRTIAINMEKNSTIEALKNNIEEFNDIPAESIKLLFAGKQCEDGRTLSDYNIKDHATLHMVHRTGGATAKATAIRNRMNTCAGPYIEETNRIASISDCYMSSSAWQPAEAKQDDGGLACFLSALRVLASQKDDMDKVCGYFRRLVLFHPAVLVLHKLGEGRTILDDEKAILSSSFLYLIQTIITDEKDATKLFNSARKVFAFLVKNSKEEDNYTEVFYDEVSLECSLKNNRIENPVIIQAANPRFKGERYSKDEVLKSIKGGENAKPGSIFLNLTEKDLIPDVELAFLLRCLPGSTNAYVWENVPAARHVRNLTLRNFMDYNVVDEVPDTTCSICNKKLNTQSKEECIVGKCKHSFHRSCAKTWIQEQKKCPFCNVKWNYQMISPKDNNGKKSSRDNNNKNDKKKEEEAINFDNYEFQQLLNEVDDVVWKAVNKNFSLIGLVLKNVLPKKVRIAIGETDDACNLLINHMRNVSSDNLKKRSSDGLKLDNNTKKHKKDKDVKLINAVVNKNANMAKSFDKKRKCDDDDDDDEDNDYNDDNNVLSSSKKKSVLKSTTSLIDDDVNGMASNVKVEDDLELLSSQFSLSLCTKQQLYLEKLRFNTDQLDFKKSATYMKVYGPQSLAQTTAPVLTIGADGKIVVYTGRGKGTNAQFNLFCVFAGTIVITREELLQAHKTLRSSAEGMIMYDAIVGTGRQPDECVYVLLDKSASMNSPGFKSVDESFGVPMPSSWSKSTGVKFMKCIDTLPKSTLEGLSQLYIALKAKGAKKSKLNEAFIKEISCLLVDHTNWRPDPRSEQHRTYLLEETDRFLKWSTISGGKNYIKILIKLLQTLGKESKIKGIVDMDGEEDGEDSESRDEPPRDYLCPVTCVLMKDPVCAADGFTYERKAIEKWLENKDTSPMTNIKLDHKFVSPNRALSNQIREWINKSEKRKSHYDASDEGNNNTSNGNNNSLNNNSVPNSVPNEVEVPCDASMQIFIRTHLETQRTITMDIHPSYTWSTLAKLYAKRFMLDLDRFHIKFSKGVKTINCNISKEGNLPMSELNIQKEQTLSIHLVRKGDPKDEQDDDIDFIHICQESKTYSLPGVFNSDIDKRNMVPSNLSFYQLKLKYWFDAYENKGDRALRWTPSDITLWVGLKESADNFLTGSHPNFDDVLEKYENLICGDEEHCKVSIFRRDKVKDKAVLSRLNTVKQLFTSFVDRMEAYDMPNSVGLILFGDDVKVEKYLTPYYDDFRASIDSVRPDGETKLFDAIETAADELLLYQRQTGRKDLRLRIVCLSDGNDSNSETKAYEIAEKLQKNKIVLDAIMIGSDDPNDDLHAIAKASRGYSFHPENIKDALELNELELLLSCEKRKALQIEVKKKVQSSADMWYYGSMDQDTCGGGNVPPAVNHPLLGLPATVLNESYIDHVATNGREDGAPDSKTAKRLMKELRKIMKNPHPDITILPSYENIRFWRVIIKGPDGTPYRSGVWLAYIHFGNNFPHSPPKLRFVTPIKHCNINSYGRVCHSILDRDWSYDTTIKTVIDCIYGLLLTPEFDDPLDATLALKRASGDGLYESSIIEHTNKWASLMKVKDWVHELEKSGVAQNTKSLYELATAGNASRVKMIKARRKLDEWHTKQLKKFDEDKTLQAKWVDKHGCRENFVTFLDKKIHEEMMKTFGEVALEVIDLCSDSEHEEDDGSEEDDY